MSYKTLLITFNYKKNFTMPSYMDTIISNFIHPTIPIIDGTPMLEKLADIKAIINANVVLV